MEDHRVVDERPRRRVGVEVRMAGMQPFRVTAELTEHASGDADLTHFRWAKSGEPVDGPWPQLCDFAIERGVIVTGSITVRHAGEVRVLRRLTRDQRRRLKKGRR